MSSQRPRLYAPNHFLSRQGWQSSLPQLHELTSHLSFSYGTGVEDKVVPMYGTTQMVIYRTRLTLTTRMRHLIKHRRLDYIQNLQYRSNISAGAERNSIPTRNSRRNAITSGGTTQSQYSSYTANRSADQTRTARYVYRTTHNLMCWSSIRVLDS